MALSFSIAPSGGSIINFRDLQDGSFAGRAALDWNVANRQYDTPAIRIPGLDGNLRMRKGLAGGDLMLTVRYVTTASTANAFWAADRDNFANASCSITDGTELYPRCELQTATRLAPEKGTADGNILFDCLFRFTIDQ